MLPARTLLAWVAAFLVLRAHIADAYDERTVSTIAGGCNPAPVFDGGGCKPTNGLGYGDGVGTSSAFNFPSRLTLDLEGNIYIADTGNHAIRRVNQKKEIVMTSTGKATERIPFTVQTIAGQAEQYGYADGWGSEARLWFPRGIAVWDPDPFKDSLRIFVADYGNHAIRQVTKTKRGCPDEPRVGYAGLYFVHCIYVPQFKLTY